MALLNEQSGQPISLDKAVQMVTTFRKELSSLVQSSYGNSLPYSETFDKAVFEKLSAQPGAVGIRAYFGLDDEKQVRLILVATNEKNEDILPAEGSDESSIYEFGQRCPPICATSPLNPAV